MTHGIWNATHGVWKFDSSGVWECGGLGVGPGVWVVTKFRRKQIALCGEMRLGRRGR